MAAIRIQLPGKKEVSIIALQGAHITIGRSPANALQVLDRTMSLRHAELIDAGGHYRLHDLGSTNGVFVNGQQVTDYHLRETCKLAFGTLECEFLAETPRDSNTPIETLPSRAEVNATQKENADLKLQITQLQTEIDSLKKTGVSPANATAVTVPGDQADRALQECQSLKTALAKSEAELARARSDVAVANAARDELLRASAEQKSVLEALPKQSDFDALSAENAQLRAERSGTRRENSLLKARTEEQARELMTTREAKAPQSNRLAMHIFSDEHQLLATGNLAASKAQKQSQDEIASLRKDLTDVTTRRQALEKAAGVLRSDPKTKLESSELEKLRSANGKLTERIKALAIEAMALRKAQSTIYIEESSRVSREVHEKVLVELTAMKGAQRQQEAELEKANRQLADSLSQHEHFERTIKAQESEIEALKKGSFMDQPTVPRESAGAWEAAELPAHGRESISVSPSFTGIPLEQALEKLGFIVRPVQRSVVAPPKSKEIDSSKAPEGKQQPSPTKSDEAGRK